MYIRPFLALIFMVTCCVPAWASPLTAPENLPAAPGLANRALEILLTDLEGQRQQVIELERELVRRPALNPEAGGQGEEAKALWIESWLQKNGLPPAERIDSPDPRVPSKIRPNLIIWRRGASPATLWLIGHLDVAPAGPEDLWTGSPWALRVNGDRLYGRGVEDNHQCVVAALLLLESLKRLDITPPMSLGVVLTSQAKSYPHTHGLDLILKSRPHLFTGPDNIIVLNDYGNSAGSAIEVAEKGLVVARVKVQGRQAHGALPKDGLNALAAGARFIVGLESLTERFPARNPLFDPPQSTFFATRIEAGEGALNQIPGKCEFFVESRFLSEYQPEEVMAALTDLAQTVAGDTGTGFTLEAVSLIPAAPPTPADSLAVRTLSRAVKSQLQIEPGLVGNGAVTMAATLRNQEPPLPVAVWAKSGNLGAAVDENISISSILDSVQVFARMLFDEAALVEASGAAGSLP